MKLTAAIAASYFGCKVLNHYHKESTDEKIVGDMRGIIKDYLLIENYDVFGNSWGKPVNRGIEDCQLLLTPLSKISDEDAVEVAKIADLSESVRIHRNGWDSGNMRLLGMEIANDIAHDYGDPVPVSPANMVKITDYLRSKGYDCGHGSIPSLIAAGVAVEPTH